MQDRQFLISGCWSVYVSENSSSKHRTYPQVLVFAGSTRNDSVNRKLARVAAKRLKEMSIPATLVELRDYPMPIYDGDLEAEGTPAEVLAFQELMHKHDALVIASPEFNGSFSALLKNLVDWVSLPVAGKGPTALFRGKTAALLSASPGRGGGQRGLRHLRELLGMIGVTVIASQLSVADAACAFDKDGELAKKQDQEHLKLVLDELKSTLAARMPVMT
jgi:chromate reductase, NAD(P)H dehydrogenase (quinone)